MGAVRKNKNDLKLIVTFSDPEDAKDDATLRREVEDWFRHIMNKYKSGQKIQDGDKLET